MDYIKQAEIWHTRALSEKDEFIKFILFYVTLEVIVKSYFPNIRSLKQEDLVKQKFFFSINPNYIKKLLCELKKEPHKNMDPDGDCRWSGQLASETDFGGIVEFVIRARNNLFHGDKGLNDKRDLFIVRYGNKILPPLINAIMSWIDIQKTSG